MDRRWFDAEANSWKSGKTSLIFLRTALSLGAEQKWRIQSTASTSCAVPAGEGTDRLRGRLVQEKDVDHDDGHHSENKGRGLEIQAS